MSVKKICPKCGMSNNIDNEYCVKCGVKLSKDTNNKSYNKKPRNNFEILNEKLSISGLTLAFIVAGVFLFIGSILWGLLLSNGMIDFPIFLLLTIGFAVFIGGLTLGFTSCYDETYVFANFLMYIGIPLAFILLVGGFSFSITSGFTSALSSAFGSYSTGATDSVSNSGGGLNLDFSSVFYNLGLRIILILVVVPILAYLGIYLGEKIKDM